MKSSVYPAVIVGLLGFVGLILLWLNLNVSISTETVLPQTQSPNKPSLSPTPAVSPTANTVKKDTKTIPSPATSSQGGLRMSNQTDQPVRVALLPKQSTSSAKTVYGKPAHWDFAPQEGSAKGLILSLPQGNLKLKQGDILVAFAQDGSGRYWGPYVVGETTAPVWDQKTTQWQLTLQP